jgi:hypothetical protein
MATPMPTVSAAAASAGRGSELAGMEGASPASATTAPRVGGPAARRVRPGPSSVASTAAPTARARAPPRLRVAPAPISSNQVATMAGTPGRAASRAIASKASGTSRPAAALA